MNKPEAINILLFEDNPGDARLIREYLMENQETKFSVIRVENLKAGIEELNRALPDVILLDLGLPDSQGLGTLEKILAISPNIPVIVLTGLADSEIAFKAVQAGAEDYLIKDEINNDLLIRVIRYAIERMQRRNQLEYSRKLLFEAERISNTGAWEWHIPDDRWTFSDEWKRIHGVHADSFSTREIISLTHPDDVHLVESGFSDILVMNTRLVKIEFRIKRAENAEIRHVLVSGEITSEQDGKPTQVIGFTRDITEQKQAEAVITRLEKRSAAIIAHAPDGTVLVSPQGIMVYASPAARRIFGCDQEQELTLDLNLFTHPDDLPQVLSILAQVIQEPATTPTIQYRFKHKDGPWLWVESTFTSLLSEPSVQAIVINFRDITDKRQLEEELIKSEANLKKAQLVAHLGSWVWHIKSNRLEWSEEMFNIFGLDKDDFNGDLADVMQRSIHPEDKNKVEASNLSVIQQKTPVPLEYRVILSDGSQKTVWAEAGELILDGNGDPAILTGIVQDITDRKRAELETTKNLERLRVLYEITQTQTNNVNDLLVYSLNGAVQLTESKFGCIHCYDESTAQFTLNFWSKDMLSDRSISNHQSDNQVGQAGFLREVIRERHPVIKNNFSMETSNEKEFRKEQVHFSRILTVPVIVNQSIVAVVAVANKTREYDETDVLQLSLLMDSVWKFVDRIEAQQELKESENRFRQLVENAPDAIYVQVGGRFAYVNNAALKLFGASHQDQILNSLDTDRFDPLFTEQTEQRIQKINYEKISLPKIEIVALKMDGTPVNVDVSAVPINWDGFDGALVFLRDITAQKQAEQTLRLQSSALQAAANAMVITDNNGIIQWCNPAWSELTGFSFEEAVGKTPRISKSGVHNEAFYEKMWSTILGGEVFQAEMTNLSKDGRVYQEDATITPLLDSEGRVTHFIAIKQDITERKKSEKKLLLQTEELNQRNEQLTRLYRISNSMIKGSSLNWEDLTQLIPDIFVNEVPDVCCSLFLLNPVSKNLMHAASSGTVSEHNEPVELVVNASPLISQVMNTLQPVFLHELGQSSDKRPFFEDTGSVMVAPLVVSRRAIGIINVQSPQSYFFTPDHEQFLTLFANQAAIILENTNLISEIKTQVNRLESLRKIDETINASLDLRVTADVILSQILQQLDVDAANFLVFDPGSQSLNFVSNIGFLTSALQFSNVRLGNGLAGKAAISGQILHIPNLMEQEDFFNVSPQLWEENFVEYFGVPLIAKGKLIGLLEIYNRSLNRLDQSTHHFMEALAGQAAIAVENIELFKNLQKSINELTLAYDENIEAWSRALDLRDKETEGHTQRVEKITVRMAKTLGIAGEELVHLRRGALLHDIGKMGIPDNILLKPGPLTEEEWVIMRKHPVYAFELLSPIAFLKPALDIPYCHHEKWDGSGYPRGLKGEQIPLAARIFAIVDVWDALCSDRPYRQAWPESKAMEHIRSQSGTHFDPNMVELFLNSYIFGNLSSEKATILIVDDEENVTRSLARSLKDNFTILTANNGQDAIEIVRRSNPAVVLTDQRMPEMTGVELLERIRKVKPDIVGILISGYSDIIALTAAVNLGNVRGFIPKPWDVDALRTKLEETVNIYREMIRKNSDGV